METWVNSWDNISFRLRDGRRISFCLFGNINGVDTCCYKRSFQTVKGFHIKTRDMEAVV